MGTATVRKARFSGTAALIGVALLTAAGGAVAALDAHYLGTGRDQAEFRIYLHGGAYVGRSGSVQTVRVTVHETRKRRAPRVIEGCVYHFDDTDRSRDRIVCAASTPGPLSGVAYARAPANGAKDEGIEPMVCVQRCSPQVPERLSLEEADEDNG